MTSDGVVAEALTALAGVRYTREDAQVMAPRAAGLYALYGDDQAWRDLDLTRVPAELPLFVGKAKRSLNGRDVGTHFASGKTGSSTVR